MYLLNKNQLRNWRKNRRKFKTSTQAQKMFTPKFKNSAATLFQRLKLNFEISSENYC